MIISITLNVIDHKYSIDSRQGSVWLNLFVFRFDIILPPDVVLIFSYIRGLFVYCLFLLDLFNVKFPWLSILCLSIYSHYLYPVNISYGFRFKLNGTFSLSRMHIYVRQSLRHSLSRRSEELRRHRFFLLIQEYIFSFRSLFLSQMRGLPTLSERRAA